MKKIILGLFCVGFLPFFASAAYIGTGDNVSTPLVPSEGAPAIQNVYLVGGTVNASNPVGGDLLAAGGTVIVSGKVQKDIMAVGGNVNIISGEAEDVRVAGGTLLVSGKVNGELMAAGGQVTVTPDAVITNDSRIAGGKLVFAGTENGNLNLAGGEIRIDGIINGNLVIDRAQKVTFGPKAVVKGTFEYSAPQEATIETGAQISASPVFHKIQGAKENARPFMKGLFGVMFFLKLIAVLAAAYLLWYTRRSDMTTIIDHAYKHFWSALLRGFGVLVLVPIAGIILLFTVVGWIPAGVMLATYVALLMLVSPIAAIVATSFLMALFKKSRTDLPWYIILVGVVVLLLVSLIPVVGWFVKFVIYVVALGATVNLLKAKFSA